MGGRRLHVGCGQVYKPGHVNIDKFDLSVADERGDALDLPYPDDSFEGVDAEQLLEHFDHIHCRYLLAEFFRVLAPGGQLVIETPDLERSLEILRDGDATAKRDAVHWIYGLDSPGLQHKTGFTLHTLKDLLEETGFKEPKREKERTHTYQPGIRVTCRKPQDAARFQMTARLRKHALRNLGNPDSYVLVPIEDTVCSIARTLSSEKTLTHDAADDVVCRAAVMDPRLALAVLDTLSECEAVGDPYISTRRAFVKHLEEQGFRGKVVSLWMRTVRGDVPEEAFDKFVTSLEDLLAGAMGSSSGKPLSGDYMMSLEPRDLGPVVLPLLLMEARRLFYLGIKNFHNGNLCSAEEHFAAAKGLNPWNPFIHWNIARLKAMRNGDTISARESYDDTLRLLRGSEFERAIIDEAKRMENGRPEDGDRRPMTRFEYAPRA